MSSSWHNDTVATETSATDLSDPLIKSLRYHRTSRKKLPHNGIEGSIIEDIYHFGSNLRQSVVPKAGDLEAALTSSFSEFERRLHNLDELQASTSELVRTFVDQMQNAESELESHLQHLKDWCEQDRGTEALQQRFNAAKQQLQQHKDRLSKLSDEMKSRADLMPITSLHVAALPTRRRYKCALVFAIAAVIIYWLNH